MAGGSSNTELIFQLRAHSKELRKELDGLKKFHVQQKREARVAARDEQKRDRQRNKTFGDYYKNQEKARRAEREHVKHMTREESKRHKMSLGYMNKQHKETVKLIKENERLRGRGGGGRGSFAGGFTGAAVGSAIARAGMGLWNFFVGGVMAGYENYKNFNVARFKASGLSPNGADIRGAVRGGARYGFNKIDTASMIPAMARATGQLSPIEMMRSMRSTGMEAGEVGGVFNTIRRAGYDFTPNGKKDSAGQRVFRDMIAGGLYSGLERARLPEYFKGVQQMSEEQQNLTTGVVSIADIMKQLALLGASGKPGLQGAAGANVLDKLRNSLTNPGGGEFGEGLVLRAMGFGKPVGAGGVSYFQAMMRREEGIQGPEGAKNIQRLMNQAQTEGGTKEEVGFMLQKLTGMSLHQAMDVQDIFGGSGSMDDKLKAVSEKMKAAKPLDEQARDAMQSIDGNIKHIVDLTDKGIGLGAKYAKNIEDFDNLQITVLNKISDGIDEMRRVLGDIYDTLSGRGGGDKAKHLLDGAQSGAEGLGGNTIGAAMKELQARVAKDSQSINLASETPGVRETWRAIKEAGLWNTIKGNMSGTSQAQSRLDAGTEASRQLLRNMGAAYALEQLKNAYGDNVKITPEMQAWVSAVAGGAVGRGEVDDTLLQGLTMPAPASMTAHRKHKKKGTNSGVVPTPSVKPGTTGTDSHTAGGNHAPKVEVTVQPSFDARHMPPVAAHGNPGSTGKVTRR